MRTLVLQIVSYGIIPLPLINFLKTNLIYPKEAFEKKIEGKVYLKYKISPKGETYDVFIIKGIGYGCDKEAIRLTKLLKYTPPKNRKLKVTTYKKLNITFKIPKKLKTKKIELRYTIVK